MSGRILSMRTKRAKRPIADSRAKGATIMMLMSFAIGTASCSRPSHAGDGDLPAPQKDVALASDGKETKSAVFAGGCFWCTEAVFEQLAGVKDVVSGYAGDSKETADYEKVSTGGTK